MDLHGQSSASFPKKSHDLDFNAENRFKRKEGEDKVKDVNLLTNWADKSKVRNQLAYEMYWQVGAGYHFAFPVRIERNGAFFSTADLVEEGDEYYTERIGLDPDGALYKINDTLENANNSVKQTRKEEGNQDLQDFISNIDLSQGSTTLRRMETAAMGRRSFRRQTLYRIRQVFRRPTVQRSNTGRIQSAVGNHLLYTGIQRHVCAAL